MRLARGTANELDDRIRARGSAASMIEVPLEREASQKDVYVENEELKVQYPDKYLYLLPLYGAITTLNTGSVEGAGVEWTHLLVRLGSFFLSL